MVKHTWLLVSFGPEQILVLFPCVFSQKQGGVYKEFAFILNISAKFSLPLHQMWLNRKVKQATNKRDFCDFREIHVGASPPIKMTKRPKSRVLLTLSSRQAVDSTILTPKLQLMTLHLLHISTHCSTLRATKEPN